MRNMDRFKDYLTVNENKIMGRMTAMIADSENAVNKDIETVYTFPEQIYMETFQVVAMVRASLAALGLDNAVDAVDELIVELAPNMVLENLNSAEGEDE